MEVEYRFLVNRHRQRRHNIIIYNAYGINQMQIETKKNMFKKHILYTFTERDAPITAINGVEGARKNHAVVLFFQETSAEIDVTVRIKELTPSSPPPPPKQPLRSPPPPRYPLLRASRHIISTLYALHPYFSFFRLFFLACSG